MSVENSSGYSNSGFVIKDSGKRQEFASGMSRDSQDGKVDYTAVFNGPMLSRWAEHLTKGAVAHPDEAPGEPNWMLADGNEEYVRFRKSAVRHFIQWFLGQADEDHAAAAFFNVNGAEYVKDKMAAQLVQPLPSVSRPVVVSETEVY